MGVKQLSLLEQLGLVFANMLRAQAVRRTVESSREIFDYADVIACGIFCVIPTLEFLQHHFAKSGHGDLLMTRQLISTARQPTRNYLTRSVRRRAATFLRGTRKLVRFITSEMG